MQHEGIIRLSAFCAVLATVAVWELLAPRRQLTVGKKKRWFANLSLVAIDTAVVRLAFPLMPVEVALLAQQRGWGALNQTSLPPLAELALAVIALDFIIYLQHVLFHFLPLMWRFHRMHHTDLDLDVTSGNRFHPVEIVISLGIKLAAVVLLGASPLAVLVFEVVLNATAMFSHGNISLPLGLDRWLRLLMVTPDMHRVHHSVIVRETNSNFGFNLPWWDRLCGTYRPQPEAGQLGMTIGLKEYRDPRRLTLPHLLVQPFVGRPPV